MIRISERAPLIQAALDGEDLSHLVDRASLYLGSPLVIISNTSTIIAHSTTLLPPDETWLRAVDRGYITLEFVATLGNWDQLRDRGTKYECMTVSQINSRRRRFYKLTMHSQQLGYLNITETGEQFDATDEEDYHFVAQLIAKELYAQTRVGDPGRKTRNEDILLDLANGTFTSRGHFIDRLRFSGFRDGGTYRVLCSDLTSFLSYNADEDTFKQELLQFFPGGAIVTNDRILLILAEARYCDPLDEQRMQAFDAYLRQRGLVCGISDPVSDLFLFREYREQAASAVRHRRHLLDQHTRFVFYDTVKVYDLLDQIPKTELMNYCSRQVYAIYQYDTAQQTEYLDTLRVYLQTNRSVRATAGYLHVHRNTVNYRIARIRELFGVDLEDFSLITQVLLSCQIIRLAAAGTD